jgi:hypothetical protein
MHHHQVTLRQPGIVQKQQMYLGAKKAPPGQANLGELCSFAEPVMDVAASQYVHDIGVTAQIGCSKTAPHKLISRYQTQPLQLLMPCIIPEYCVYTLRYT